MAGDISPVAMFLRVCLIHCLQIKNGIRDACITAGIFNGWSSGLEEVFWWWTSGQLAVCLWSTSGLLVAPKWIWLYLALPCCTWLYLGMPWFILPQTATDWLKCFCIYKLKCSKVKMVQVKQPKSTEWSQMSRLWREFCFPWIQRRREKQRMPLPRLFWSLNWFGSQAWPGIV